DARASGAGRFPREARGVRQGRAAGPRHQPFRRDARFEQRIEEPLALVERERVGLAGGPERSEGATAFLEQRLAEAREARSGRLEGAVEWSEDGGEDALHEGSLHRWVARIPRGGDDAASHGRARLPRRSLSNGPYPAFPPLSFPGGYGVARAGPEKKIIFFSRHPGVSLWEGGGFGAFGRTGRNWGGCRFGPILRRKRGGAVWAGPRGQAPPVP